MSEKPILVIDDEPEMRAALSHALKRSCFSVKTASNGPDALSKIKKDKFCMVISDMRMPEMTGLQVLGEIKKISPFLPVVMMTAYGTINNAVTAMKEGAADYIIKPFSAEMLEETVKKVLRTSLKQKPRLHEQENAKSTKGKALITEDPKMIEILGFAVNVAPSNSTVLILGESGTGKEMLASHIHANSGRSDKPYVAVNCAALPENLAESELFGHEKGAFTGAANRKMGKFELAGQGTIVLDEISEMPMPLQAKLLRALQEKEIDRVGGSRPVPIDARIIAISNVDLKGAVKKGKFREDLFYRINVIPFTIPALRERKKDIPLLVNHFLKKYCSMNKGKSISISKESLNLLSQCEWKGNVRELENTIERAVIMAGNFDTILPKHLFIEFAEKTTNKTIPFEVGTSVKEMEKKLIENTLEEVNDNRTHAAKLLGISIRTLRNKLSEYKMEV